MRIVNLFLTIVALTGLAGPAVAGEDRFYLDFDLPAANQPSANSFALSPAGGPAGSGFEGFGLSMGYALPRESGEWRIAAGLSYQSPFALQGPSHSELAALHGGTSETDTTAMVSLLYAFDLGDEGLFGMNMRPFVGGGIGLTRRPGDAASATTGPVGLTAEEQDQERYNLSWGLTAGVNMPLSSNLNLSLSYRYFGQGENDRAALDREAGDPDAELHSHDLMLIFGVSF